MASSELQLVVVCEDCCPEGATIYDIPSTRDFSGHSCERCREPVGRSYRLVEMTEAMKAARREAEMKVLRECEQQIRRLGVGLLEFSLDDLASIGYSQNALRKMDSPRFVVDVALKFLEQFRSLRVLQEGQGEPHWPEPTSEEVSEGFENESGESMRKVGAQRGVEPSDSRGNHAPGAMGNPLSWMDSEKAGPGKNPGFTGRPIPSPEDWPVVRCRDCGYVSCGKPSLNLGGRSYLDACPGCFKKWIVEEFKSVWIKVDEKEDSPPAQKRESRVLEDLVITRVKLNKDDVIGELDLKALDGTIGTFKLAGTFE